MRAFITSLFICFSSIYSYAQSTAIAWSDIAHGNFGGTYAATMSGDNFFAAEVISQTDSRTIRVKKYNSTGTFQTTAVYSDRCQTCSASNDIPLQIFPASDGGAFLYYEIADNSPVLKKIAPAGNIAWTQTYNSLKFIKATPTKAGGIYLLFQVTSGANANRYFVYNLDVNGATNWTRDLAAALPNDMAVTLDNGLIITDADSTKHLNDAGSKLWAINRGGLLVRVVDADFACQADTNRIIKFNLNTGNIDFVRNQQGINDLLITSDKGIVFSTNDKTQKLSTSGNSIFINTIGSQRLVLAANGDIGSIGTAATTNRISVINSTGSLEWQKSLTYNLGERIIVHPSPDNGWFVTTKGQVPGKPSSYGTGFLYKFYRTSAGCTYGVNISPNAKQSVCKTGTVAFEVTQPNLDLSFGVPSTDYVIQWTKDNQSVATNTLTYTGTQAGEYSASITQGNCVNKSPQVTVDFLGNTAPTLTSDLSELCLNSGANVILTSAGCSNNSSTSWSNNQTGTTISVSPNSTTNYIAQCVDAYVEDGVSRTCISSPSNVRRVTVLTTSSLSIPSGIISADAICQGTSEALNITVNGDISAPLTYLWTRDNASISSQSVFNASTAGSYQVTVKDRRGCSAQSGVKELKLLGNETPAVTTSISEICREGGVQPVLSASSCTSTSYSWNNNASSTTPSITVSPLNTTEYSVRCSDTFIAANNSTKTCLSAVPFRQTITVRQQSNIEIVDLFVPSVFCKNDGQAIISTESRNFVSPANLEWFKDGVSISKALFINVSDPGDYQVEIRDARGCTAKSAIKKIERSKLSLALTGNQQFCEGTNTNLLVITTDGIGASTFEWKLNNQAISTSNAINVTSAGNYVITATDAKGCQEVLEVPVTIFPKITADYKKSATVKGNLLYNFDNSLLSGGKQPFDVTLTATSATNKPVSVSQNNVGRFNENSTISVKVKDANGCSFSDNIQINYVACNVALKISGDTSFCYYDKTTLQVSQLSGIDPFTYSWTVADITVPNENSPSISTGTQGIYRTTVRDSANCTVTSEPYPIRERGRDIIAFIRSNGDSTAYVPFGVDLNATTQTGVTYQWFRNDTLVIDRITSAFKATRTGDYKIRVSKNGCFNNSNEIRVTILIPLSSEPTASISEVTAFPNPTDELFVIKSATKTPLKPTCRIVDMQGREVYSEAKPYAATEHEWQINASQWVAGTYVYRITTTNGEASGKIIKR